MNKQTSSIISILDGEFNISGPISSFAYRNEISCNEICGLASCLDKYLQKQNFNSTLSSSIFSGGEFKYNTGTKCLEIDIQGALLSADIRDIVKDKIVQKFTVVELGGTKYLRILYRNNTLSVDEPLDIRIDDFFPLYRSGYGVMITQGLSSEMSICLNMSCFGDLSSKNLSDISSSFGNKVFITNPGTYLSDGMESDLSVVKIPIDEYNMGVAMSNLNDSTLYVVSADYVECYGQQICNVTMSESEYLSANYLGIAATKTYVDDKLSSKTCFGEIKICSEYSTEEKTLEKVRIYKFDSLETYNMSSYLVGENDIAFVESSCLNAENNRILSVSDPEQETDGVNRRYVDNVLVSVSGDTYLSDFMTKDENDIDIQQMLSAIKFIMTKFGAT